MCVAVGGSVLTEELGRACMNRAQARTGQEPDLLPDFFCVERGIKVFSRVPNSTQDLLKLRKERRREESLLLKQFACAELNIERLANLMSNSKRLANSGLNNEISPLCVHMNDESDQQ